MYTQRQLKRPLIYTLIGSVIIGAFLGIVAVLRGVWGWYEVRVMLTAVTLVVACLAGLACELARTPRGANRLPQAGLLLTLVSAAFMLFRVWVEIDSLWYWKPTAILLTFTAATIHICLLSIAKLAAKFRVVYWVAFQVVMGLAGIITAIVIFEIDSEMIFRLVAVISIVAAALTLLIPLLHRLSRADLTDKTELLTAVEERNIDAIDQEIIKLKARLATLERLRVEHLT